MVWEVEVTYWTRHMVGRGVLAKRSNKWTRDGTQTFVCSDAGLEALRQDTARYNAEEHQRARMSTPTQREATRREAHRMGQVDPYAIAWRP